MSTYAIFQAQQADKYRALVARHGGDVEAAWSEHFARMEGFDGEAVIAASAKMNFMIVVGAHPAIQMKAEADYRQAQADEDRMIAKYMERRR